MNLDESYKTISLKRILGKLNLSLAIFVVMAQCPVNAETIQNDSDGDGLQDAYELKIGSESYLSDTDGDAVKDADEIGSSLNSPLDTDNDGVIDILDYDDDNDGLPTYLESKEDSDNDGKLDYLDTDSDNDGITDGEEAGVLNQDKNLDGIDDAFDLGRDGAVDNNGDGIDDHVKLPDHDNDGKPDYLDANFQHQKPILVENNKQDKVKPTKKVKVVETKQRVKKEKATQKKIVNQNTTIKDVVVAKNIAKPEDMIINRHTDSDNDGLSNSLEKILGTNHLSRDSDGDKVSDAIEIGLDINSPQDSDHDGIIDALDDDDDNDGVLTKFEDINQDSTAINDDTDGDGVPNYLDANDDGDELLTKVEGATADSDGDGIPDYLDRINNRKNNKNNDKNNVSEDDSNTTLVSKDTSASEEPEIVVLFDGDAAALVDEEEASVEKMLENTQLDENENAESLENSTEIGKNTSRISTSSKSHTSHWNLF